MAAGGKRPIFTGVARLVPYSGFQIIDADPVERTRTTFIRGASGGAQGAAAAAPATIADASAGTFGDHIAANIPGAGLPGETGHLNREPGEALSSMSANQIEGAP